MGEGAHYKQQLPVSQSSCDVKVVLEREGVERLTELHLVFKRKYKNTHRVHEPIDF